MIFEIPIDIQNRYALVWFFNSTSLRCKKTFFFLLFALTILIYDRKKELDQGALTASGLIFIF